MMEELQKWIDMIGSTLKNQQEQIDGLIKLNQEYVEILKQICNDVGELKKNKTELGIYQLTKKE
jgi:hypothetical protein